MNILLFANNAQTTLASPLGSGSTTATLSPGSGALFPAPGAGQCFLATLTDAATGLINEIVLVTNVTSDVATIVRAQEGTSDLNWLTGDFFSQLLTAGSMGAIVQADQLQSGTYSYAVAAGTVNALTATVGSKFTAIPDGMPFTLSASGANTLAAVTLTLTLGVTALTSKSIVKGNNLPLVPGDIPAAGYNISLRWNAGLNAYVMQNPAALSSAWVNFNGTGTIAIRSSYNVASLTDNGTGDYTINFTNTFANANYSAVVTGSSAQGGGGSAGVFAFERLASSSSFSRTSSAFRMLTVNSSNTDNDCFSANATFSD